MDTMLPHRRNVCALKKSEEEGAGLLLPQAWVEVIIPSNLHDQVWVFVLAPSPGEFYHT